MKIREGRAPQGARGLKRVRERADIPGAEGSRPARGAWIETDNSSIGTFITIVAPRKGRVD